MSQLLLWALLNGVITGGVWVGIVMLKRQRRLAREQMEVLEDVRRHLDSQEQLQERLAQLEERLDFTERLLIEEREGREGRRLPPGSA